MAVPGFDPTIATSVGCAAFCLPPLVADETSTFRCIPTTQTKLFIECQEFIQNFTSYKTHDYVQSFADMYANGYDTVQCADSVEWDRVFAAQCRQTKEATPKVYFQIATDSMPPHCLAAGVTPVAQNI